MKEVSGGITAPKGFLAAGVYAGIKRNRKLDLALIYSEREAVAAGVFTTNRVKAAPVIVSQRQIRKGVLRAVIVNSGNANACTGRTGMMDEKEMAEITARALSIDKRLVGVASTGVIGAALPMDRIRPAIGVAAGALSAKGGGDAAAAIMTTDTFPKEFALQGKIGGKRVTVGGIAKGSGMIYPNMATMLAFVSTEAVIERDVLTGIFKNAADRSFNRITVDGDTSTNDMALCLANGMAGTAPLAGKELGKFQEMLDRVCAELARMIVKDGEGATKLVEVRVRGARSVKDADRVGRAVANSMLVKTAIYACDPNWGRIMAAIGYAGAYIREEDIAISFDRVTLVKRGVGLGKPAEERVAEVMKRREYTITIDLNVGDEEATVLTTDLSYDYVKINVAYRS